MSVATKIKKTLRTVLAVAGMGVLSLGIFADAATAQNKVVVTGQIQWGVYINPDGCMHWYADGGLEGYSVTRYHPNTNLPFCMEKTTCLIEPENALFATDSARLTATARQKLAEFFQRDNSFSYAVYGHTDSRASFEHNEKLSVNRALAVAQFARSQGALVETVAGIGEHKPVASNSTAAGMQQNRRVQIVCYRLPE